VGFNFKPFPKRTKPKPSYRHTGKLKSLAAGEKKKPDSRYSGKWMCEAQTHREKSRAELITAPAEPDLSGDRAKGPDS
jgi:hypothetical protein